MSDGPINCFPLRSEWEREQPEEPALYPMPEITTHDVMPPTFAVPRAVLSLAEYAREHSWDVLTQYSRGFQPHGTTGTPSALKECVALRFGRHPMTQRRAYAVYMRTAYRGVWSWDSVMMWGPGLPAYKGGGLEELKTYLARGDVDDASTRAWVDGLKAAAASKVAAPKAPARKKAREGMS